MMYYILYPGDTETDAIKDTNQLGEDNGFGVFWANRGFQIFKRAINENHDVINHFRILDERKKSYSIEDFLDAINGLQIRTQE